MRTWLRNSNYITVYNITTTFPNTVSSQGFLCAYAPSQKISGEVYAPCSMNKHIATANRTAGEQPSATRTVLFSSTSGWKPETFGHDNDQNPPIQPVANHTQWLRNFRKTNSTNIAKATYKKNFRVDVSVTVKTATTVFLLWHCVLVIYAVTAYWRYTLPTSSSWNVHNHLPG